MKISTLELEQVLQVGLQLERSISTLELEQVLQVGLQLEGSVSSSNKIHSF